MEKGKTLKQKEITKMAAKLAEDAKMDKAPLETLLGFKEKFEQQSPQDARHPLEEAAARFEFKGEHRLAAQAYAALDMEKEAAAQYVLARDYEKAIKLFEKCSMEKEVADTCMKIARKIPGRYEFPSEYSEDGNEKKRTDAAFKAAEIYKQLDKAEAAFALEHIAINLDADYAKYTDYARHRYCHDFWDLPAKKAAELLLEMDEQARVQQIARKLMIADKFFKAAAVFTVLNEDEKALEAADRAAENEQRRVGFGRIVGMYLFFGRFDRILTIADEAAAKGIRCYKIQLAKGYEIKRDTTNVDNALCAYCILFRVACMLEGRDLDEAGKMTFRNRLRIPRGVDNFLTGQMEEKTKTRLLETMQNPPLQTMEAMAEAILKNAHKSDKLCEEFGGLLQAADMPDHAIRAYRIVSRYPDYCKVWKNVVRVYREQGKLREAAEEYLKHIRYVNGYLEGWDNLTSAARIYQELGDEQALENVLKQYPRNYDSLYNTTWEFLDLGLVDKAIRLCLEVAARLEKEEKRFEAAECYIRVGEINEKNQRPDQAREMYMKAGDLFVVCDKGNRMVDAYEKGFVLVEGNSVDDETKKRCEAAIDYLIRNGDFEKAAELTRRFEGINDDPDASAAQAAWTPLTFEQVLEKLPPLRRQILEMRDQGITQKEIGTQLGKSASHISQMERGAIWSLKGKLRFCKRVDEETFNTNRRLFAKMGFPDRPPPDDFYRHPKPRGITAEQIMLLDMPIKVLDISVRAENCCINCNIQTVRDLVTKDEQELLKTKNFGRKSLKDIKNALGAHGLHLGMKLQ